MKILMALTYYRPYISGLTICAEKLAKALSTRGHRVTILTSRYDKILAREETVNGVRIIRVPVAFRINKGVIMPAFTYWAAKLSKDADLIHLFLPQFDAPFAAIIAKFFNKPVTITYVCDLRLPIGLFNRFVNSIVNVMNHLAMQFSDRIVALTKDYAEASPFLKKYLKRICYILPPVKCTTITHAEKELFRRKHRLHDCYPVIGMVARMATEKGIEVLVEALPLILGKYPGTKVLYAGQCHKLYGEEQYAEKLMPIIQPYEKKNVWSFLGVLPDDQLQALFGSIDVLVVPSLNSTESYGMVQIEAMINGVSVVASDLPGVKQPVLMTGQGKVVPVGDSRALAESICDIVSRNAARDEEIHPFAANLHDPDHIASQYEALFRLLIQEKDSA